MNNKNQRHSQSSKLIEDLMSKINLVGMRRSDGCFYPGFFSKISFSTAQFDLAVRSTGSFPKLVVSQDDSSEYISGLRLNVEAATDFTFAVQGKIDEDGHFYSLDDDEFESENLVFPSVRQVLSAQNRHGQNTHSAVAQFDEVSDKSEVPVRNSSNKNTQFLFSLQGGLELNVSGIFSSGIWHFGKENEYFLAGVFDGEGRFKAAYCITRTGYLVPGTTNKKRKFIPLSKYVEDGSILHTYHGQDLSKDQRRILEQLLKLPSLPKAQEFLERENVDWICVRNGAIITEPAYITVSSEGMLHDQNRPVIYVGGKIGPDGQFYLYGTYNDEGYFFPGGPPVITDNKLRLLPRDDLVEKQASDKLYQKFGIRLMNANNLRLPTTSILISNEGASDGKELEKDNQLSRERLSEAQTSKHDPRKNVLGQPTFKRRPSRIYNTSNDKLPEQSLTKRSSTTLRKPRSIELSPIAKSRKESSVTKLEMHDKGIASKKLKIPPTIARKREIERKARKEKPEVQAKYENATHFRFTTGDRGDSTQQKVHPQAFSLLDPSLVLTTLHTDENLLRDIGYTSKRGRLDQGKHPGANVPISGKHENLTPNFVKRISAVVSKTAERSGQQKEDAKIPLPEASVETKQPPPILPPLKHRDSQIPTAFAMRSKKVEPKSKLLQLKPKLSDTKPKALELPDKKASSEMEETASKEWNEKTISDSPQLPDLADDSSVSVKRNSKKSLVLPDLRNLSSLSFTKSFGFSYFNLPAYVKNRNDALSNHDISSPQTGDDYKADVQEYWHTKQPSSNDIRKR